MKNIKPTRVIANVVKQSFLLKQMASFLAMTFIVLTTNAQAPQGISYQGVARGGNGQVFSAKNIGLRMSVLDSGASGTAIYVEEHSPVATNVFGLFSITIGKGIATTGNFSTINWAAGSKFLKVEMDTTASNKYVFIGTSQLLSVPYALYAAKAGNVKTYQPGYGIRISGDSIINDYTITKTEIKNDSLWVTYSNGVSMNAGMVKGIKGEKGDTGVAGKDGKNGVDGRDGLSYGKTYLSFSGDITDIAAAQKIIDEAGSNTQVITIQNCTQLTKIDLSSLVNLQSITILFNSKLTDVYFPNLKHVDDLINVSNNPMLQNLNFDSLSFIGGKTIINGYAGTDSMIFPELTFANSITIRNSYQKSICFPKLITGARFACFYNKNLETINLPMLKSNSISFVYNYSLKSVSLPLLDSSNEFEFSSNYKLTQIYAPIIRVALSLRIYQDSSLVTLYLPNLKLVTGIEIWRNSKLSGLVFPKLDSATFTIYIAANSSMAYDSLPQLRYVGNYEGFVIEGNSSLNCIFTPKLQKFAWIRFTTNHLSSGSVNSILAQLVSIKPTLKNIPTIELNYQNPAAKPTGQGITDKATLISNGNSVSTD